MKRSFAKAILFLTFAAAAGGVSVASAQSFTVSVDGGSLARGRTSRGTIVMTIPAGLHVNSNRPISQYAIPTSVRVTAVGVRIAAINYPRGKNRKFQFSDEPINVYQGRIVFRFAVRVPQNYAAGAVRLRATVRFQACTEEVCYPPKTQDITFSARVR